MNEYLNNLAKETEHSQLKEAGNVQKPNGLVLGQLSTASVTDRFLDAAQADKANLAINRRSMEDDRKDLIIRLGQLNAEIDEVTVLQEINLQRIMQLEKAKIDG
jgi:hypothetical protein